jgi:hypothetical protein
MRRLNYSLHILVATGTATLIALMLAGPATTQLHTKGLVSLQATTPGVPQTGHLNISGTAKVGGFTFAPGAFDGKVLMSDSIGQATWQTDSLTLPFTATATSATSLIDVINTNTNSGANCFAISAECDAEGGAAIWGGATGQVASGVRGLSNEYCGVEGEGGIYGVMGTGTHAGLFGQVPSGTLNGSAIYGQNFSPGIGVQGLALAQTGINIGGFFESFAPSSMGVYGYVPASTGAGYGVYGESKGDQGRGVFGEAGSGNGACFGVYGKVISANGWGVFAQGRSGASGTKSFRIDHPFDPLHKFLLHYSAEGPIPQNIYNGRVTTDEKGVAWVQLPAYYGEINKDPIYTLTVVDNTDSDAFVLAKVSREIENNRFKIRTSAPNVTVCWEVKATRNDLWVRKYGAPVEEEKLEGEDGTYQHPELYGGQPKVPANP